MLVARDNLDTLRDVPPAQWSPQKHGTLEHLIFPNSIIICHPDYISLLGMFSTGPGETLFVHTMLTPEIPADDSAQSHWDRSFNLIDGQVFNGEDLVICEQSQAGLACGANEDFVLGGLEDNVRRFHATIAASLSPAASDLSPPGATR